MKKAEGKYVGVRAITREEAVEMAPEIFRFRDEMCRRVVGINNLHDKLGKLCAEEKKLAAEWCELRDKANKLWAKGARLRADGEKLLTEGDKLLAMRDKLRADGNKLWADIAVKYPGYILVHRAMSFIAADRDDDMYCFVWPRKEIWIYNGEDRPKPNEVEKLEWRKSNEKGRM